MSESKIPHIEVDESQALWLGEIYKDLKKGKSFSYREMISKHYKKLPQGFNPNDIDSRLLRYGEELTLVAINQLDPKRKILEVANKVVFAIKELLIGNPEKEEFTDEEIISLTNLENNDVQVILGTIGQYSSFWTSASGSGNRIGYKSIKIDASREYINQYLYFENIEDLILRSFERDELDGQRSEDLKSKGRRKSIFLTPGFKGIGGIGYEYELEDENDNQQLSINPIFQSKVERVDKSLCFVLMPFTEEWSSRVYLKLIKPTVEGLGLQCLRADNLTGPIIVEDIWTKINQSGFIIADVTGRNPNVMYELGIVHTLGKPAILTTQEIDQIPFDFVHLRHHRYEDNFEGFENFSSRLNEMILSLYGLCGGFG